MSQPVDLSVIIVNYNTADLLPNCLNSVLAQAGVTTEVFVVDNGSADNSVALVKSRFPAVTLIESATNLGFARANNLALPQARGRFIYFLNPDTEVTPGAFAAAVASMERHPKVGLAGTRLLFPDGRPQPSVEYSYPGARHARQELAKLPGEIAWLLGASLIVRPEVLARTGGFDERFFLYGEDVDLGLTVRRLGWELGFIPEACVVHWEGQSERGNQPLHVLRKKLAAELLFYRKHYSAGTLARIRRARRRQAAWRLLTLALCRPFVKNREALREKIARYRLVREIFA